MEEKISASQAGLSPAKRLLLERWKRSAAPARQEPETAPLRRREAGPIPLSSAQQRLWFLDQLLPGSSAYNLSALVHLSGRLDAAVLTRAFGEIAARHEILRTAFRAEAGVPAQVILPRPELEISRCDCRRLPSARRRSEVLARAEEQAARPFDLWRGATLRAMLFRLDAEEHDLLVTLHHIVSDGWSVGVFLRELAALYDAGLREAPSPLAPLPLQYADFAVWQQRRLATGNLAADLDYWRRQLRGAERALELPADRPRPPLQSLRGGLCEAVLDAQAAQAAGALARDHGVTLFMACLAAFQTLLARSTGADDVPVGSPVAGRPTPDLEALIGLFVNVVVMRGDLSLDPRWSELLERVRHTALEAYAHQELPFERLVDELQPDRDLGRNPLFQVMLAFQNAPLPRVTLRDLTLSQESLDNRSAMFDLALSLRARDGVIALSLEFSSDLFEPVTARRLLGHFASLLAGACADPRLRLSELPLLTAEERRQLLLWNDRAAPFRRDRCLHELFAARAAEVPHLPAVVCGGEALSYGELDRQSNQLARALRRLGVGPEVPVGLCAGRTTALATAMLGILKAGGAFLPLDPTYPRERLAAMAGDARVPVLLLALGGAALARDGEDGQGAPEGLTVPGARILSVDADREWIAREDDGPLPPPAAGTSPESLAYVIYTSGSTGRPKGVACVHRGVVNLLEDMERRRPLEPGESCGLWTSISFDVSVYEIFSALCYGGALCIPADDERTSGELLFPWLARHRVRSAYLPPFVLAELAEWAAAGGPERRSLARLLVGVEPIPERQLVRLLATIPGLRIVNGYGPTEATVCATFYDVGPELAADRRTPLGLPVANCRVHLLDAHQREVPVGVAGEVWIGGAGLARGYLDRPELTAERFVPDPIGGPGAGPGARCYRTGDLARRLPDGNIVFLGRADRQAKVRGFRIEPGEVEAALGRHPGVQAAVVTVRRDPRGETQLVAYAVPRDDDASLHSWHEFLARQLPAGMLPAAYVSLSALPTTPNGKIDIKALPEPDWSRARPRAAAAGALQDPIAILLAGVWSELLGGGPLSPADDFFALGGHSLLATQVVSRVREIFAVDLPLRVLFEARTLGAFAQRVGELTAGEPAAAAPALGREPRTGPLPLSFAQQRLWFVEQLDPGSTAYHLPVALRADGALDAGRLAAALAAVVRRHETLRTRFVSVAGHPVQVVDPPDWQPLQPLLPIVDLAALAEPRREGESRRLRLAESGRAFDLARGPLLRSVLLRRADDAWDVLLTMHHIVSDGWSMGVLLREVSLLYGDASSQLAALPELQIDYADFAVWQRRRLSGEVLEGELAYWRQHLSGAPPLLELPADRPRGAARDRQRPQGGLLAAALDAELSAALAELARQRAATPFMVLLAAFESLLGRLSGAPEVCVGTPIAGRTRRETEELIGLFVNTLVMRGDLSGDPAFAEHLTRVRSEALAAYAHQELPFEKLVEELAPERSLDHSPLFQAFLALQNAPLGAVELPGVQLSPLAVESGAAKFDLALSWTETAAGLAGSVEYDTSLFDRSTVARLAGQLESVLRSAASHPERRLSELALLSAGESQQLLVEWRGVTRRAPPTSVPARLSLQAARTPQAVAVVWGDERLTYGELDRRAGRLARRLRAGGVRAETRVGLLVERSLDLVVGLLAIWRAGGAAVPLDPGQPRARLALLAEEALAAGTAGAVGVAGGSTLVAQRDLRELLGELPLAAVPIVWVDEAGEEDDEDGAEAAPAAPEPEDLAYLIYTSGTTGRPKAVMVEHGSLAHTLGAVAEVFGLTAADRMPVLASAAFDIFLFELLAPLLAGGTAVLFDLRPTLDLARLAEELQTATLLHAVPAVMRQLTARLLAQGARSPHLRRVFVGGDAVRADLLEAMRRAFPGAAIAVLYGPTEGTILASWDEGEARPGSWIGRPLPGVAVEVRDDTGAAVPIGVAGELWLGGPGVARGYLGRPELTAERFVPGPGGPEGAGRLYRTGDRVRFAATGRLEFLGRVDRQVKVRGYRIEPGEVEASLREHPAVREAAVLATVVKTPQGEDERLVALVTGDGPLATGELRRFVEMRLPSAMVPSRFIQLEALPLTRHGKVDHRALAELAAADGAAENGAAAPPARGGDPIRETLAAIFAAVLGREGVSADDDFFDLGGHSLLATQVIARASEAFGVDLPLRALFEEPTAERLGPQVAALLSARLSEGLPEGAAAPALVPVERDADLPLSFAQERLWFLQQLEPGSATYNMPLELELTGALAAGALAAALTEVVRRQESLRTTFAANAEAPCQRIAPAPAAVPLPLADLSALPAAARRGAADGLARQHASRGFDLERGPLMTSLLVRLTAERHRFLLNLHHAIADGWSIGILARELGELYAAAVEGRPARLPLLPIQYADYAHWQRRWLADGQEAELAYWESRLGGDAAAAELPTDRPRPAMQTFRGGRRELLLPAELTARLKRFAREESATLFMALLAATQALLARHSGEHEVAVGAPVAGRRQLETEGLIGCFLNTLVLRTDTAGQPSFRALVARVRTVTLEAYSHQDVPFEAVLGRLRVRRDLSRAPLFQVLFNFLNLPAAELSLPDLELRTLTPAEVPSKLDLTFYVTEADGGVRLDLVYNADLFDEARMAEVLAQLQALLGQAVERPDDPVEQLSLVTAAARAVLPDPAAALAEPAFPSVARLVLAREQAQPERTALCWQDETWTYSWLGSRARQIAGAVVAVGDRSAGGLAVVAVAGPRCPELIASLLGVFLSGRVLLTLDRTLPPARLRTMIEVAKPGCLIYVGDARPEDRWLWELRSLAIVAVPAAPAAPPAGAAAAFPEPLPDAPAYIFFTSGTTGRPKAVLGRQKGLGHFLTWQSEAFGIEAGDRIAQLTGLSFDAVLRDVFLALTAGATLELPDEDDMSPEQLLPWLAERAVTVVHTVPSLAGAWLNGAPPGLGSDSLRRTFFVGEPLLGPLVERWRSLFPRSAVVNLYGATETTLAKCFHRVPEPADPHVQPAGRAMPQTQALVLGATGARRGEESAIESFPLCGIGEVGEIALRTPFRSLGYLNNPDETRFRFRPNPFRGDPDDLLYFTGDRGRYRLDGTLEILGRLDEQVKIRGVRIEPAEIRVALGRHAAVRESAVVLRDTQPAARGERGEPRLVAYVVLRPGADLDRESLRRHLRQELPEAMVPTAFVALEALPLTANGKLDSRALPAPPDAGGEQRAPSTPFEDVLAAIWREVLGVAEVGPDDNFFDLGGHSLLATRVVSHVRRRFHVELRLHELFEEPTVAALARRIEGAVRAAAPPLGRARRDGDLPLSFAQERLWFIDRLQPESPAYNLPLALDCAGALDAAALGIALAGLAARHETLRTRFELVDGGPVQRIDPPGALTLPSIDLAGLPPARQNEEEARLVAADSWRPFDLAGGALARARLLRLAADRHTILLVLHHSIADGWSLGILVRDLSALYREAAGGEAAGLPELPLQYADYAVWQRAWLAGQALEGELAYWRGKLAGAPPLLELPTDRPRPPVASWRGAARPMRLDAALAAALRDLGQRRGATPFMVLAAAFLALLGRLSTQDDVTLGMPIAGRTRAETEDLVGFFVNTLALRAALPGGLAFGRLVDRVRADSLAAYEHQEVPFERLVEELRVERSLAHSPLFQAIFALQNAPVGELALPGLVLKPRAAIGAVAKFDLTLTLSEVGEEFAGALSYAAALFDATTIDRLLAGFATLLAGAAADAERRLDELPLLSAAERAAVAVEWSGAPTPYPREATIPSLFAREAARRPATVAVEDAHSGERWTYGELAVRAGRLARRLAGAGVGPEVPVGLFLERSSAAVAAMLAILEAGGAYLPLDPALPLERLAWLLADTAAPVVVTRRGLLAALPDAAAGRWKAIAIDDDESDESVSDGGPPLAPASADSIAYITYTSGSTGEPKGVAVVHRGVVRLVRDTGSIHLGEDQTILQLAPLAFDASTFEVWGALLNGGRLVVAPSGMPSLAELAALIAGHGVTTMFMTTALFHAAVDSGIDALRPLSQLIVGGEVMSPEHLARARAELAGVRLVHAYGPTENTTFTTCGTIGAHGADTAVDAARAAPIGRPIANTSVHLLDGALRPVPIGAAGELCAGGDGLARCYFRRPAETAERFVPDPLGEPGSRLYRTGDLARFLADGEVDFLGRIDAQVKIRGFRIEPGEVESALAHHPKIGEAAVVVAGGASEKRLVTYCVPRRADLQPAELARFLRRRLPEYLVPSAFVLVEALPLTAAGKVDRRTLAARPLPEPGEKANRDAASRPSRALPCNPIEELLASLFASLLGRDEVAVDDDFFALGGHSLLATRAIARLREALGVELPVAALFERPTVAGLAEAVAEARAGGGSAPPLVRVRRDVDLPLSFAQERLWFIDRLLPGNPAYNLPLALDCDGALDAAALAGALAGLAARHETLRTRFELVDGGPVQRIDAPGSLDLPSIDLAELPSARRKEEEARLIAAESWRPFDLARGPLARARLLRLAADRHALLLVLHHSIADGWSLSVLVRDLSALYRQAASGEPASQPMLPELPVQYADYSAWQRAWLVGQVLEGELAYWREKLAGAPPLLELPTDRPRPPVASWQGGVRPARLGPALSSALLRLGRRQGATPFMVLAAGFLALLGRLSNQDDATLGMPIAGRTRVETEDLVGFFVNTLALRAAVPGDLAFGRLVERVRADSLAAYEHQEVPFERLVEELRVERSLAHSPLFQVMFALQNAPVGELSLPRLALRPRTVPGAAAKFDLTLTLSESEDGFTGGMSYATALFDATTIDRLLAGYANLMEGAAAEPERRLDELPLLAAATRHQVIAEWNDSAGPLGEDVLARFAAWAQAYPAAEAVEEGDRTASYGELAGWAGALSARLRALGVGIESRVAVLAERSMATVAGYLAVLAAGGAYVALDPQQPAERLAAMMEDAWRGCAAPVLLAQRALAAGFAERLAASGAVLVDPAEAGEPAPFAPVATPAEAAAYVIYTSGSTGTPKGVVVSRGALANLAALHLATYEVGPGDRSTLLVGTGFDISVWEIWPCLAAGATLVAVDEETRVAPAALAAWLASRRITVSFLPTALAEPAMAEPWPAGATLRALVTGGDRLHEGPPAALPFPVVNLYGPAECTVASTAGTVEPGSVLPSIGRPIGNLHVRLLAASGQPVPVGVTAELAVGGAGVARGYLGDSARTAERFVPDPLAGAPGERLYRTGDLARFLPDGRLDFLGRRDRQVKIRGIRIELGEIEAALAAHSSVAAGVAEVHGAGPAARIVAYVVPAAGELAVGELRRWLKDRLPPAMIPAAFVEMAALPLTANGKVDRAALPEPAAEALAAGEFVPPSNALEELLSGLWAEVLGGPRVGANDSFFDLGGHSLQAVRLMNRIRDDLGVELKVRAIFEAPTLAEFAALVAEEILQSLEAS